MRPIVELMFVDFFGVCMDAIYNLMAKNTYFSGGKVPVPMVLMASTGAGYSTPPSIRSASTAPSPTCRA